MTPSQASFPSVLHLCAIGKTIREQDILKEIDLEIKGGEHVILTGPSGAGKTTLLRIIAGLETPTTGELFLGKERASFARTITIPPHQRGIAMVFQDLGLWPHLNVLENVMLAIPKKSNPKTKRIETSRRFLSACEIEDLADRKLPSLSGGEQQRVALARAFAAEPAILLLDEAFAGLDLTLKESLFQLIGTLKEEQESTAILTVTHSPHDALALQANRIVVIENGTLVENDLISDFLSRPSKSKTLQSWARRVKQKCSGSIHDRQQRKPRASKSPQLVENKLLRLDSI